MTGHLGVGGMASPKRILIVAGVDGSDTSVHAGAYAAGMARRMDAVLVLVFVHTLSSAGGVAPGVVPAVQQAQEELVAAMRREINENESLRDLDIEIVERSGNPFHELVSVATERQADAVVIGASMQAGHRLVGSLATHLVRKAKWPVTVVP